MGRKDKVDRKVCLELGSGHQVGCGRVVGVGGASIGRIVGIGTTMALGMIGLMLVCPVVGSEVRAEELPSDSLVAHATVDVAPMIAIGLDSNNMEISLTPQSTGAMDSTSTTLTVSTNNIHGYKILVSGTHEGKLVQNGTSSSINPLTSPKQKLTEFGNNTWGYAITDSVTSDMSYSPVTSSATVAKDVNVASAATADTYQLALAAKVDTTLPAGTYQGMILVSAVANPITITSMDQLFFMQDITPELCTNATLNKQTRLIDLRDGKSYWVAKLADGKCWMTQNLALDIYNDNGVAKAIPSNQDPSSITGAASFATLNDTNTNLASGTNSVDLRSTTFGADFPANNNQYNTWSWNLGNHVLATPLRHARCSSDPTAESPNADLSNSVRPGQDLGTQCKMFWKVQEDFSPTLDKGIKAATWNGLSTGPNNTTDGIVVVDTENKTYDAHYLIGNYYQFNTSTAGNGGENAPLNSNIATSICPKGWRLPRSGSTLIGDDGISNASTGNEFAYAFYKVYGYENQIEDQRVHTGADNFYDIYQEPMYLVSGGDVHITYRSLWAAGLSTYLRTSTTNATAKAQFQALLVVSDLKPNFDGWRGMGDSVRCLAE